MQVSELGYIIHPRVDDNPLYVTIESKVQLRGPTEVTSVPYRLVVLARALGHQVGCIRTNAPTHTL